MKKLLIPLALLALLVIAAMGTRGLGIWGDGSAEKFELYGNVDIRTVDLGFRVGGRITAIPVEEGASVPKGETLARLEATPLRTSLDATQAKADAAQAELEKLRNGNRPQDIAQAEAALAERRAALAEARVDYERQTRLLNSRTISQSTFDVSEAQFRAAEAQVTAAEEAVSLMREGARPEDIAAAVATYAAAIAQRDRARTDYDDAVLVAPAAGTILTRAQEPGAIVPAGGTVLTLAIDRPVRVRAYVAEPDLGRVAPGMSVEINTDSRADAYHGTIGFISATAEFTPKTVQTETMRTDLVYRLRITVEDPDDMLRQGQPVTVRLAANAP